MLARFLHSMLQLAMTVTCAIGACFAQEPSVEAPGGLGPMSEKLPSPESHSVPRKADLVFARQLLATISGPHEAVLIRLRTIKLLSDVADEDATQAVDVLSRVSLNGREIPVIRNRAIDALETIARRSVNQRHACKATMLTIFSSPTFDLNIRLHALNTAEKIGGFGE